MREKLKPCPNPECRCPIIAVIATGASDEAESFATCTRCGMSGPVEDTPDEAARLWNLIALPRPEAGAVSRDEVEADFAEIEEYFDQRQDADCDETGFIPNAEMRLLQVVEELKGKILRALPSPAPDGEVCKAEARRRQESQTSRFSQTS